MDEDTELTDIERHEGSKAGIVVSVRLKPDEATLLHALADRDGRTLSETLRVALHAFAHNPTPEPLSAAGNASPTRGSVFVTEPDELTFVS